MRVLVACEFSGVVRDAFIARGHDAWSCDIIPTERPGPHIVNDVRNVLDGGWDMMIAHPDCTYLTRSGCKYWPIRYREQRQAIAFVNLLWNAPIPRIVIENPLGILSYRNDDGSRVWRAYDQLVQPWQFGHPESKGTCLWLKNVPPLMSTVISIDRDTKAMLDIALRGVARKQWRSRTFPGIASAMAQQWAS